MKYSLHIYFKSLNVIKIDIAPANINKITLSHHIASTHAREHLFYLLINAVRELFGCAL